jgi:hypothetical protein
MFYTEMMGKAGSTINHTCDDTAEDLEDVTGYSKTNSDGKLVTAVAITVETNDIRFSYTSTPTQAGLGHILVAGASTIITNPLNIANFKFINETNGSDAGLQITPFYGEA